MVVNAIVYLQDTNVTNGATRVLPGTHLSEQTAIPTKAYPCPYRTRTVPIPAHRGSVLFVNGAVWHGAGDNNSPNQRVVLLLFFNAGWIRSQMDTMDGYDDPIVAEKAPHLLKTTNLLMRRLLNLNKPLYEMEVGIGPPPHQKFGKVQLFARDLQNPTQAAKVFCLDYTDPCVEPIAQALKKELKISGILPALPSVPTNNKSCLRMCPALPSIGQCSMSSGPRGVHHMHAFMYYRYLAGHTHMHAFMVCRSGTHQK